MNIGASGKACGKNCMGTCCLPGTILPRYCFAANLHANWAKRISSFTNLSQCSSLGSLDDSETSSDSDGALEEDIMRRRSFLELLMVSLWDEKVEEGMFRYSVHDCLSRDIEGVRGFVAQYNEGRHLKKRPTEFRMDSVLQNFDPAKFNFTKMGQGEVLFAFEDASDLLSSDSATPSFVEDAAVPLSGAGASPNIVAINVSPIGYGHVLLIPRILDCMPQRIDAASMLLAMRFVAEVDSPSFRLGYNSLGAFATVNHLHFQGYFQEKPFAVEQASTSLLWTPHHSGGVEIRELSGYPVQALVFEVGTSQKEAADLIAAVAQFLQNKNAPFNIFIAACGSRVFLYPQAYAERQAKGEVDAKVLSTEVNPAVFEISGHMVMKKRGDFDGLTETFADRLLKAVALVDKQFRDVKAMCLALVQEMARGKVAL